ncbi:hypothetical protein DICA3_D19196 [Diutina catenulata]
MASVDNYYDICVNSKTRSHKPATMKRAQTVTNSRPSDYYIKKLSNCSLSDESEQSSTTGTRFSLMSHDDDEYDDEYDDAKHSPDLMFKVAPPEPSSAEQANPLQIHPRLQRHASMPALRHTSTSSSSSSGPPTLTRTKTRYVSMRESKERKEARKKKYDEDDGDDVILEDHQLFNVPMLRNFGDLYKNAHDFVDTITSDNKYPAPMRPCPLPGKLDSGESSPNSSMMSMSSFTGTPLHNIEEDSDVFFDDDTTIVRNISQFYTERSLSSSKLVKSQRDTHAMYKLPQYVRSQSSVEELHTISPEKLELLDQSRPINLPPKSSGERSKHQRQFNRVLTTFEGSAAKSHDWRLGYQQSQQQWQKLVATMAGPDFHRKFDANKNELRKLSWDSNTPPSMRYSFWSRVLASDELSHQVSADYRQAAAALATMEPSARAQRDAEYDIMVEMALQRPLWRSICRERAPPADFKSNYRHMLHLVALSESGLAKRDEIWTIPLLLVLFQQHHSIEEIYTLLGLVNAQVFTRDLVTLLNRDLGQWSDAQTLPHSYTKSLASFADLSEFDGFNATHYFEVLCQINDSLPLPSSAPSTPVVGGAPFNFSAEHLAHPESGDDIDSASLQLMVKLMQNLIVYAHSPKTRTKNNLKVVQTFMVVLVSYYHINWNSYTDLVRQNRSIKLNNTSDKTQVLESFAEKWRQLFKK